MGAMEMAEPRSLRKRGQNSERFGPEGAKRPTRAQLTAMLMETFPNPHSGMKFTTIAHRIGALYADNALKRHTVRGVQYGGRQALSREYELCMNAIPDMEIRTSKPRFRKDGSIEIDWVLTGTHTGDFRGVPPSGEQVEIRGTDRFRVEGMLITEHEVRTNYDTLGWNGIIVGAPKPDKPLFPKEETDTPGAGH